MRVERLDGTTLVSRIEPARPHLVLTATPSRWSLAGTYLTLGVEHILLGIDHLLFVLALMMLVKGRRKLVGTITAFTLAHSVTLAAATLGWVAVPGAPVEAVIALSIVFVAAEIRARRARPGGHHRARAVDRRPGLRPAARLRLRGCAARRRPAGARHPARASALQRRRGDRPALLRRRRADPRPPRAARRGNAEQGGAPRAGVRNRRARRLLDRSSAWPASERRLGPR